LTWFRREPDVYWIEAFGDDPQTLRTAIELAQANPFHAQTTLP